MSNYYDDMKNLIRCAMAVVAGLAISGMLAVAPVNAEPAAGEGDMAVPKAAIPDEIMKEAQQLQQEIMELQKKLDTIQQAAIAGHPELQKEQKDFMDLLVATMQQQGKDPAKDLAQLRDMQARLEDKSVSQEERNDLSLKFRKKDAEFQQAQQNALGDEGVRKAQKHLNDSILAAMKDQDVKTEELINQYVEKQQRMMEIRHSVASRHQQ